MSGGPSSTSGTVPATSRIFFSPKEKYKKASNDRFRSQRILTSVMSTKSQKRADQSLSNIPWSMTHRVRELSGFFKDFRGTCLTSRLMALSRPAPDTLDAGSMSIR